MIVRWRHVRRAITAREHTCNFNGCNNNFADQFATHCYSTGGARYNCSTHNCGGNNDHSSASDGSGFSKV
jgi:hypothetical protein